MAAKEPIAGKQRVSAGVVGQYVNMPQPMAPGKRRDIGKISLAEPGKQTISVLGKPGHKTRNGNYWCFCTHKARMN